MRQRGYTLVELLIIIAIIGLVASVAIPSFMSLRRRAAVRSAAAEIRSVFHEVRSRAIARHCNAGVKFTKAGSEWQFAIYDDGDGDGVRTDDIVRRVDREVSRARFLWQQPQLVSVSLPPFPIVDPDGDDIEPGAVPVQFNRSTLCSFSPIGQATPGTIYLTDSAGEVYAIRVYGPTAKIRVLRYVAATRKWESR